MVRLCIFVGFFVLLNGVIIYRMSKQQRNRGSNYGQSGPGPDIG